MTCMYKECENKNGTGATTIAKNESFFFVFFLQLWGGEIGKTLGNKYQITRVQY